MLTNTVVHCLDAQEHMSPAPIFDVASEPLTEELDEIFREHYPLVYRTAYSVTGTSQDAEDIVQTTPPCGTTARAERASESASHRASDRTAAGEALE